MHLRVGISSDVDPRDFAKETEGAEGKNVELIKTVKSNGELNVLCDKL